MTFARGPLAYAVFSASSMKQFSAANLRLSVAARAWAAAMALVLPAMAIAAPLKVGDKAPPIVGQDQDGRTWKLADFAGKKIVLLYFYPKDDTPGCTKQACTLRDWMADLKKDGVEVVGVSFDSAESHRKFIAKHGLNFTLLADVDGKIADAFGVRRAPEAKMSRRVSFLIGRDGTIVHVTDTAAAETHLAEYRQALERIKKP